MTATEEKSELSEGWAATSILELCELIRGVSYAKGEASTTPSAGRVALIRANNIGDGLTFDDLQFVPQNRVSADQRLRVGDVVVAMSSGSKSVVGKAASVNEPWDGTFGAFCGVLRPSSHIDSRYFGLFFQTKHYRNAISEASAGTNINNLKREYFAELLLPVAPLGEQRRIVVKVEELLTRVNAARKRLAKIPRILKRFRQSILAAACSGQLTPDWRDEAVVEGQLPNGWSSASVSEVCDAIVDCPHSTPKWTDKGEVCLRTTNFLPGRLDLSEVRFVSHETYNARVARLEPRPGDVLYSREGGILGIACVFPTGLRACLGQRMMLMRSGKEIRPNYLMHVLNSPSILEVVRELTGGTAAPHLNVGDIKAFSVPLPPIEEQDVILRRTAVLTALADKIESRVKAATARVEKITQAILAKAFLGELVPTEAELARQEGRDYEMATALLERIRAKRQLSDAEAPKRGRRKQTTQAKSKSQRRSRA